MCLAIPGKVIEIKDNEAYLKSASVSFAGVVKDINVSLIPEVECGDYVIVHAGVALSILDEKEANIIFKDLEAISEISEEDDTES